MVFPNTLLLILFSSDHPHHAVSYDSTDIFPVGWCESNSYPLKPPLFHRIPSSSSNSVLGDER